MSSRNRGGSKRSSKGKSDKRKGGKSKGRQQKSGRGKNVEVKLSMAKLAPNDDPLAPSISFQSASHYTLGVSSYPRPSLDEFNASAVTKQIGSSKGHFTDPDEQPELPPSIVSKCIGWKRVSEIYSNVNPKNMEVYASNADDPLDRTGNRGTFGLALLKGAIDPTCRWARLVASHFNFVLQNRRCVEEGNLLWELISPSQSTKQGPVPKYNPNGRYIVKLFHQDAWRSIEIDDYIPVDEKEQPLFPTSAIDPEENGGTMEVWPLLLTKALLKLYPGEDFLDQDVGVSFLHALCGWVPRLSTSIPQDPGLENDANRTIWLEDLLDSYDNYEHPVVAGYVWIDNDILLPPSNHALYSPRYPPQPIESEEGEEDRSGAGKRSGSKERKNRGKSKTGNEADAEVEEDDEEAKDPSPEPEVPPVYPSCYMVLAVTDFLPRQDPPEEKDDKRGKRGRGKGKPSKVGSKGSEKAGGSDKASSRKRKGKMSKEEEAKMRKEEEDKRKREDERKRRKELKKQRKIAAEKEMRRNLRLALGRQVQLIHMLTGETFVIGVNDFAQLFPSIHILVNPRSFANDKHVKDVWENTRRSFAPAPCTMYVPPTQNPVKILFNVEAVLSLEAAQVIELEAQAKEEEENKQAKGGRKGRGKGAKGRRGDSRSARSSGRRSANSRNLNERKQKQHLDSARGEDTKSADDSNVLSLDDDNDNSATPVSDIAIDNTLFETRIDAFDWESNTKTPVAYLSSTEQRPRATLELILPANNQGMVYRITTRSRCGYFLSAYSNTMFSLSDGRTNGREGKKETLPGGPMDIWVDQLRMDCHVESGVYQCLPLARHIPLFKYVLEPTSEEPPTEARPFLQAGKEVKEEADQKDADNGDAGEEKVTAGEILATATPSFVDSLTGLLQTRVSSLLHMDDQHLARFISLEWINNDTYASTRSPLLDTPPIPLVSNENGYTLVATAFVPSPSDFTFTQSPPPPLPLSLSEKKKRPAVSNPFNQGAVSGQWYLHVVSDLAPESFSSESVDVQATYVGEYKTNHELNVMRNFIAGNTNNLQQVACSFCVSAPNTGLICNIWDVDDLQSGEADIKPVLSKHGIQHIYVPVLYVSKDQKYLMEVKIDPLTQPTRADFIDMTYELQTISAAPVTVFADKTQEDEFQAIKTMWTKSSAGRDKKAVASRAKFLEEYKALSGKRASGEVAPWHGISFISYREPVGKHPLPEVESIPKPPIVSVPLGGQRASILTEETKAQQKAIRDKVEEYSALVQQVLISRRTSEMDDGATEPSLRSQTAIQWRDAETDKNTKMNQDRAEYRAKMLDQEELMFELRNAINALIVGDEDGGKKKSKKGEPHDSSQGLNEYMTTIEAAMVPVNGDIPKWKAKALLDFATARLQAVCIGFIRAPMEYLPLVPQDLPDKEKIPLMERLLAQVEACIQLAGGLEETSQEVIDCLVDGENFLVGNALQGIEAELKQIDDDDQSPDLESLQAYLACINRMTKVLNSDEVALVEHAQAMIDLHDQQVREATEAKAAKRNRKKK